MSLFCFVFLSLLVVITGQSSTSFYDLNNAADLFKNFVIEYGKNYKNDQEYSLRYEVFKDNLRQINKWNRDLKPNSVAYKINLFSDLSYEEFSETHYGFSNFTVDRKNVVVYKVVGDSPDTLDWRDNNYVTAVKDQGSCGSCYCFSAIGNIEGQYAKKNGQLISLSDQQGLDCDNVDYGCKGGYPDHVMQALAQEGGAMREEDYPYQTAQGQCRTDKSKIAVVVTGGSQLGVNDEDTLKNSLYTTGPLSIAMQTSPELQTYSAGMIYDPPSCNDGKHAVLLVGYGTDPQPYWLIKNSWSATWGDGGYFKMARGKGTCGIGSYVATATVE